MNKKNLIEKYWKNKRKKKEKFLKYCLQDEKCRYN